VLAQSEIDRLTDELKLATEPPGIGAVSGPLGASAYVSRVVEIVEGHLAKAQEALHPVRPFRALRDWYSGAALERTWLNIHRADEALLMIQSPGSVTREYVQTDAAFLATIGTQDPRYIQLAGALAEVKGVLLDQQKPDQLTGILRSKLRAARNVANTTSDIAHETVRRWRNLLLIAGGVLAAFAAAVTIVPAFSPAFFSLEPSGVTTSGDVAEPWQVALVGSLGGALAAVLALNRFSGFTDPAGLPVLQALLRIPTAAVTSLIGVLLMQTATLGALAPQKNMSTVLAYSFFFGYAQEPLLRALDRQAGAVLDPARSKDEPVKNIPPPPPSSSGPRKSSSDDTEATEEDNQDASAKPDDASQ
jgi:hypothetical protein